MLAIAIVYMRAHKLYRQCIYSIGQAGNLRNTKMVFGLLTSELSEETRKLQLTGGSTYIISLPKRWILQNQLKRGTAIGLREEEGGLLTIVPPGLTVQKRPDEAAIRVSPKDDTEMIARKIVSAYLAGYNSIHIKTDKQQLSAKQRHDMKIFVRSMLVGTEIVTDTSSS